MTLTSYFASLNVLKLFRNMPGGVSQGIIWGIMALGIYITFRLLDVADLTVDGSFTTGGAVTVMLILAGWPAWAALLMVMLSQAWSYTYRTTRAPRPRSLYAADG